MAHEPREGEERRRVAHEGVGVDKRGDGVRRLPRRHRLGHVPKVEAAAPLEAPAVLGATRNKRPGGGGAAQWNHQVDVRARPLRLVRHDALRDGCHRRLCRCSKLRRGELEEPLAAVAPVVGAGKSDVTHAKGAVRGLRWEGGVDKDLGHGRGRAAERVRRTHERLGNFRRRARLQKLLRGGAYMHHGGPRLLSQPTCIVARWRGRRPSSPL